MKFNTFCQLALFVTTPLFLDAKNLSSTSNGLPLPEIEETLTQALTEAERILTENILSHAEISITYHGTSTIPLRDISLEVENIALVHLTDLQLHSSPFHMTGVTPNLRLMNLHLEANISFIQVTGNYTVSVEIMNHTSRNMITSDMGNLNLTFENLQISGLVGLNLHGNNLHVHTVDLLYRPSVVVLKVIYLDENGETRQTEERNNNTQGAVEEPIYTDLAKRLNLFMEEELNKVLGNVTIPELMGNNEETEITFKTRANNQIENLNEFVDIVLNRTLESLADEIRIPDIERSFEKKVAFIKVSGRFKAEEGWFRSLKTLHRTSDVILERMNGSFELSAAMGLSVLEFGYEKYSAKFMRIGPRGRLTATVGKNSVSFRGKVIHSGNNCTVTLEELKVQELDDIVIDLTGLAPFNWILSKVATYIVNRSKENIITTLEETVGEKIRNKLVGLDCGSFIPLPASPTDSTDRQ